MSIAKNTIQIHSLFERMHVALVQAGRNNPTFLDIIANTQVNDSVGPSMESIFQEMNDMIRKLDEYNIM